MPLVTIRKAEIFLLVPVVASASFLIWHDLCSLYALHRTERFNFR